MASFTYPLFALQVSFDRKEFGHLKYPIELIILLSLIQEFLRASG